MKLRILLSATALTSASFIIPTAAWAAETAAPTAAALQAAPAAPAADAEKDENIVVTGSRIRRPNLESNVPVTSLAGEELFNQGQTSLGDTLNDLPQLRSTFAQQNPGAGVGIAGLSLLDLRGLGTIRTLVLVNGRRHVPADILNFASSPDVNTIPNDLVERIDIVTGGSSAVYGSDAIAGVVNFVLKRDFNGVQVRGQAAVSEAGYGANQYASILAGRNFADGRGNITAHVEYANQARIYASDIPFFRQVDGFATVDVDSGGLPSASDGFPDAVFVRDIRSTTTNRFGLVAVPQQVATGAPCGTGTLANNGPANTSGTPFSCNFVFSPDGTLNAQTGTRFGSGPAGTILGGNGQTSREGTQLSILPSDQRINANLLARFAFSDAAEVFFEGKYVRTRGVGNQLGPTFLNNSTASLGNDVRLAPRLDNPFLSPTARTTIANAILASNCGYAFGTALASATCQVGNAAAQAARVAAVNDGSYRFLFARNLTDSEDRDERFDRQTYRFVAGLRGQFNDDWNYEISANYGKFEEKVDMRGFVDRQRFLLSLDAARNPATGTIQCRAQFDAAAAIAAPGLSGSAATPAKLAADIAACVPYNPFGQGNNAAAAQYFRADIQNSSSISQLDITGFVSGDSSQLFSLPGGPVRFALGGEYRREKAFNNSDSAADTGLSNSVFLGDVNANPFEVKEVFGEINIPVLKDFPFFHNLTFNGAGRISDYNTAAGTTYSYNGGVDWAPIRDIRFRANYGRAVRAPNVSESGFPAVPNFANGFIDPCNANAIGLNPNRAVNCAAQLSAAQLANLPLAGYSLGVISGSNPNLQAEKSDSYTFGVVVQPSFFRGFSFTADYYNIRVKNVIATVAAQTILNSCYDSPGLSSSLCSGFQRNLTAGNGPLGELPGQILNNSTVQGPQNFASRVRKGLDIEAAYRGNIGQDVRLNTRFIYTHSFQNSNYQDPSNPNFENILLREVGDPQDEFRFNADVTFKAITFGYQMRYLGSQLVTTYENVNPSNGVPPLNSDAFDVFEYPVVIYHSLRTNFAIGKTGPGKDTLNFFFGVDNLTDQKPPFGTTATGAGTAIYNIRGRNYYAGFKANF